MKYTLLNMACVLAVLTATLSCKKGKEEPQASQFQPVTFRFGADSTAITIDQADMVIKNMPRNCDVNHLVAKAVLPAGYKISPDASTAQDYTKGVSYTITTDNGKTYSLKITAPAYDPVSNAYGIYTAKHLSDVRKGLADSYVLMNDIQLPEFNAPGANAGVGIGNYNLFGWYSIGSRYVNGGNVAFSGSLDGQNHVIKNLGSSFRSNSDLPGTGIDAGHDGKGTDGLFGYAIHASFKNIGIQLASAGLNDLSADGSEGNSFIGALVGSADSCIISNCYATGTASIKGSQYIGGLAGRVSNSSVSKCYAVLTPSSGSAITSSGDGGGLIGSAFKTDISDSYALCSVLGSVTAGGLIGSANSCTVKTCYASGNVAETPMNVYGSLIAINSLGGLIGSVSSASPASAVIQNCYATGAVAGANGINADFHKSSRIGGLIGTIGSVSGPVSISNCYATGAVSRVWTNSAAPFFIGALAGNTPNGVFVASGVCTNYWDKATTGQVQLGGADGTFAQDNAFATNGKSTAEMKATATFANWDFSSIWSTAPGTNNGYPYLRTVIK